MQILCKPVLVYVCGCGGASGRGLGEGQGCVCYVNTLKATDMKGRGREKERPHPVTYILFPPGPTVFCSCCGLKSRGTCWEDWSQYRSLLWKLQSSHFSNVNIHFFLTCYRNHLLCYKIIAFSQSRPSLTAQRQFRLQVIQSTSQRHCVTLKRIIVNELKNVKIKL